MMTPHVSSLIAALAVSFASIGALPVLALKRRRHRAFARELNTFQ